MSENNLKQALLEQVCIIMHILSLYTFATMSSVNCQCKNCNQIVVIFLNSDRPIGCNLQP